MALDIARLGFVVDSSDVRRATTDLGQMERQAGRVEKSTQTMSRGFNTNMAAIRAMAYRAAGAMGALAGAVAAASVVQTSDQYVEMTNSLRVLGMTAEQAADRLSQIGDIARRTRTPLSATAQLYQRVSIASRELGATQEDVLRFTENVGLALAQQGGSAESASGALMQLSQALAGGVVRAEEFNSILEGAYPIAQAAADGIDAAGGSIGRLRKLMLDGQVTSKMFFDAILSQTPKLSAAFAGTVPTVSQAMQVLRDQWTLAIGQMGGGTSALSTAILRLADGVSVAASAISNNMNQIIGVMSAATAAVAVYYTPAIYGAVKAVTLFGASLVTLRGAMIATGIGAMVVAAGLLIGKFLELVQAVGGFGNAMSLLGDLAAGVWQGIIGSAAAIPPGLASVWASVQAGFLSMIARLQEAWANFLGSIVGALDSIGAVGFGDVVAGAQSEALTGLVETEDAISAAGARAAASAGAAAAAVKNAWEPARAAMQKLRDAASQAQTSTQKLNNTIAGGGGGGGEGAGTGGSGGKGGGKGGAGTKSETEIAADKAREALEKLRGEHALLQATLGMTETQERAYRAAMELGAGATAAQRAEVMSLIPEMARLEEQQRGIRERARMMQDGFREMFTGIISGAKSARDALADMASKLADMMANRAFDSLLAGGLGRLFGGDPPSAALSRIPGLATGGHVNRGGWAMVGERGPELVRLPSRSTVYSNQQTRQAMSGGMTYSPTFHVGGSVTAEDLAAVRREAAEGFRQMQKTMPSQVHAVNRDPLRRSS